MIARFSAAALLALAGSGFFATLPAAAQTITGAVVDPETEAPLSGVHVRLLDDAGDAVGATFTEDDGRFRLAAPGPGTWRLAAELLGRATITSAPLDIEEDEVVRVEIRMGVDAVRIEEPVVITARRSPPDHEFHRRRMRGERTGFGYFIHGDDLDFFGSSPTDLLRRVPGVSVRSNALLGQVVSMRGGCVPAVFIDGMQINQHDRSESLDTYVAVQTIEGIEVYKGPHSTGRFVDRSGCGLVLVWTKRGEVDAGRPFSWTRLLVGLGLVAGLLLLGR